MNNKNFYSPAPVYRGKPFWCWNGALEKEQLLKQLDTFKTMGMGGVFFHSRTGLETPYLDEEWFSLINACADYAEKKGLEAWIYDEDRWPSGTAGGMVTETPWCRMKYLRATVIPAAEFSDASLPENVVAMFSADMDGIEYKNLTRLEKEPTGDTVLVFSVEEMRKHSNYNGYTYVDTMCREATEKFLSLTHEQYKKNCKDRIGKSISGVFTDEPHRGSLMCGFSLTNDNAEYLAPYTSDLFDVFRERMGYSLEDRLPELFFFPLGEKFSKVKYDYVELVEELFIERFITPIAEWCRANGLQFTGHMLHEDWLAAQVCMAGSLMRIYEHMDIPGIDVLERDNRGYWIAKQLQSVARQVGKPWLLSEMFGVTGWHLSFADHKHICDWQLLFGINQRCQHLAWYTMKGEAKRDYPASISHQSYWHKRYSYMEDYFSRVAYFMQQGDPVCDVLVLNPIESVWGRVYPGWATGDLHAEDETVIKLQDHYEDLLHALCGARIDFDYGDEEQIGRLGSVREEALLVGKMRYKTVIVPEMLTIRSTTLRLIKSFCAVGGRVIVLGQLPQYVDGVYNPDAVAEVLGTAETASLTNVAECLKSSVLLSVNSDDADGLSRVFLQVRSEEKEEHYMLLNTDADKGITITIGARPYDYLEKWNARNGEVTLLSDNRAEEITVYLAPRAELLLVSTAVCNQRAAEKVVTAKKLISNSSQNSFEYTLGEKNVCVLDGAEYTIDGKTHKRTEMLKIDEHLRRQYGIAQRGGDMVQPWYRNKYGDETVGKPISVPLTLNFTFNCKTVINKLQLVVETPEDYKILINGKENKVKPTNENWVDACFKVFDIEPSAVALGENKITLKTNFSAESNLENIFLLGNFGVKTEGNEVILTDMPVRLSLGDIGEQGFRFYGGGVTYKVSCPAVSKGNRLVLSLEGSSAAAYVVKTKGGEEVVAFAPYECDVTESAGEEIEIEYLFTRRNTFGPFRQNPPDENNCNPMSFRSEGDEHLENGYITIPQGMTKEISFYEVSL